MDDKSSQARQLLPKLAIADRCSLDDRHLVVRGDLRSYKIHLGITDETITAQIR